MDRRIFRRGRRPAHLRCLVLHAAVAAHRRVLFHLDRDRCQPVDRVDDPDHRGAVAGAVLGLGTGVVAGRRSPGRNAARRAHAASPATSRAARWLQRIGAMFTEVRTGSTMLNLLLMLLLGVIYFTVFCTLLSLSLGLAASPLALLFDNVAVLTWDGVDMTSGWLTLPLFAVGLLLLFVTLHVARAFGKLHGMFAKQLLVKSGRAGA
ncbi:sensor domain-containing protein [Xanthomonas oryzae]|uniref:sensor domain-containing protein n=1 Tax=Xanthomonas oryzae TaxID=347 RepID=UPI00279634A8|nr:sensor domain-containing protein [Xanthomonas oryzae]